jgi:hypothetical protein
MPTTMPKIAEAWNGKFHASKRSLFCKKAPQKTFAPGAPSP